MYLIQCINIQCNNFYTEIDLFIFARNTRDQLSARYLADIYLLITFEL